jgi:hypothetical protein
LFAVDQSRWHCKSADERNATMIPMGEHQAGDDPGNEAENDH